MHRYTYRDCREWRSFRASLGTVFSWLFESILSKKPQHKNINHWDSRIQERKKEQTRREVFQVESGPTFQSVAYRILSWFSPDRAAGSMNARSFPAMRLEEKHRRKRGIETIQTQGQGGFNIRKIPFDILYITSSVLITQSNHDMGHYL